MIRRTLILSLLGLLMALVLSCKAAPIATTPMPTPTATVGIKAYTDQEAKLSIQYPEGWIMERTILEGLDTMIFRETVEEDAPELIVLSGSAQGQGADQVLEEALFLIQALSGEANRDWRVGEAETVTIGGRQGRRLFAEYTRASSGFRHKVYLLGIGGDGLKYAFTADAPLDEWDDNWPIFEAMLNSLRFLEP